MQQRQQQQSPIAQLQLQLLNIEDKRFLAGKLDAKYNFQHWGNKSQQVKDINALCNELDAARNAAGSDLTAAQKTELGNQINALRTTLIDATKDNLTNLITTRSHDDQAFQASFAKANTQIAAIKNIMNSDLTNSLEDRIESIRTDSFEKDVSDLTASAKRYGLTLQQDKIIKQASAHLGYTDFTKPIFRKIGELADGAGNKFADDANSISDNQDHPLNPNNPINANLKGQILGKVGESPIEDGYGYFQREGSSVVIKVEPGEDGGEPIITAMETAKVSEWAKTFKMVSKMADSLDDDLLLMLIFDFVKLATLAGYFLSDKDPSKILDDNSNLRLQTELALCKAIRTPDTASIDSGYKNSDKIGPGKFKNIEKTLNMLKDLSNPKDPKAEKIFVEMKLSEKEIKLIEKAQNVPEEKKQQLLTAISEHNKAVIAGRKALAEKRDARILDKKAGDNKPSSIPIKNLNIAANIQGAVNSAKAQIANEKAQAKPDEKKLNFLEAQLNSAKTDMLQYVKASAETSLNEAKGGLPALQKEYKEALNGFNASPATVTQAQLDIKRQAYQNAEEKVKDLGDGIKNLKKAETETPQLQSAISDAKKTEVKDQAKVDDAKALANNHPRKDILLAEANEKLTATQLSIAEKQLQLATHEHNVFRAMENKADDILSKFDASGGLVALRNSVANSLNNPPLSAADKQALANCTPEVQKAITVSAQASHDRLSSGLTQARANVEACHLAHLEAQMQNVRAELTDPDAKFDLEGVDLDDLKRAGLGEEEYLDKLVEFFESAAGTTHHSDDAINKLGEILKAERDAPDSNMSDASKDRLDHAIEIVAEHASQAAPKNK